MVAQVATSASISRLTSLSSSKAPIADDVKNIILNESSRIIDSEQDYKDELAFCNRLACILTKERELPKICQGFPTVVQTVNEHAEKLQHQEIFHQTWQRNLQRTNTSSFPMPPISGR
uniref:Uncharacterized protein n=1 Tax=Pseudo-nitzschia australis TaxID=44445 RepID=A0A7S4A9S0_9STRA|mmetsp:Transcript_26464/g.57986  ORF Transcript_26464/g.57986 Transcript_26464/m.57986 type:complete len:118 (+) Transcript_26464:189-542(+)